MSLLWSKAKGISKMKCSNCGHWNSVSVNKILSLACFHFFLCFESLTTAFVFFFLSLTHITISPTFVSATSQSDVRP